jgi:hypothetical protein
MSPDDDISAEVHQEVKTKYGIAYRVKAFIPEHGIFINGMMVYPPNAKYPDWRVMPPGIPKQPNKFVVEFNKHLPVWQEVEERCLEAAQLEHSGKQEESATKIEVNKSVGMPKHKDVVIEDFDVNAPINLDDIEV